MKKILFIASLLFLQSINCLANVTTPPPATVVANDDVKSTNQGVALTFNVISNDTQGGVLLTPSTMTGITINFTTMPIVYIEAVKNLNGDYTGSIKIPDTTPAGTYQFSYEICNLANCDSGVVIFTVLESLNAVNDSYTTNAGNYVSFAQNIFYNDIYYSVGATISNTTLTVLNSVSGITVDAYGNVTVNSTVLPGVYTINYKLCDKANLSICDTATITITIVGINAVNDTYNTTTNNVSFFATIFANDTYYGAAATANNTTLTVLNSIPGITVSAFGNVTLSATLAPGTYTINYQLCDKNKPTICDTATITIKYVKTKSKMNSQDEVIANPEISIYPNPTEGIFNIDLKGYDESTFDLAVYNTLGQLIHKGSVTTQNANQIDLTRFEAGSYYITLQNATTTINKIIVKK